MKRRTAVLVWCGTMLLVTGANAQVTRITPLNHVDESSSTPVVARQTSARTTAKKSPLRDPDPYRAMQAAYQPLEPADMPPTLLDTPSSSPSGSTTTIVPGTTVPGSTTTPGIIQSSPSPSTVISPAPGSCSCSATPAVGYTPAPVYVPSATVQYVPAPAAVQYTPAPTTLTPATVVTQTTPTVPVVRAGFPPVLPLSPSATSRPVMVSQGILGQPVVYVPGQPVRNLLRYLTP